jgi:hypothetical protein
MDDAARRTQQYLIDKGWTAEAVEAQIREIDGSLATPQDPDDIDSGGGQPYDTVRRPKPRKLRRERLRGLLRVPGRFHRA